MTIEELEKENKELKERLCKLEGRSELAENCIKTFLKTIKHWEVKFAPKNYKFFPRGEFYGIRFE